MNLPAHIERTKNRSSRGVLKDGIILIKLARGISGETERKHIEILTRRLTKAHARETLKRKIDPLRDLLSGRVNEVKVSPCTSEDIVITLVSGKKTKATRTSSGWSVVRNTSMSEKKFHQFLWKLLSISLERETARYVREVNQRTLKVRIQSISLKCMRSRWGRCSHGGHIALSTPLLFTTKEILEYVIIHELAHVQHMNHSKAFWNVVEKHCKEYKEQLSEIRKFKMVQM